MSQRSPMSRRYLDSIEYGYPACSYIECEIGLVPESCLNSEELNSILIYQIRLLIRQTEKDREQHYDLDGVSVMGEIIVAGSA